MHVAPVAANSTNSTHALENFALESKSHKKEHHEKKDKKSSHNHEHEHEHEHEH